jgi:hypothetical protein
VRNADFGFPDTLRTKLRYADTYVLASGVGAIANQVMQMNSPYDPDFSGVGHQPMWFDRLCGATGSGIYDRYRVVASTIKVTFSTVSPPSLTTGSVTPALVGVLCQRNNALLATNTSALMETNNCKWAVIGDKGSGNGTVVITNKYSPRNVFGIDPEDDTISANYASNPALQWFAHVFKVDDTGASSIRAYVDIVYDVVFYGRNENGQS